MHKHMFPLLVNIGSIGSQTSSKFGDLDGVVAGGTGGDTLPHEGRQESERVCARAWEKAIGQTSGGVKLHHRGSGHLRVGGRGYAAGQGSWAPSTVHTQKSWQMESPQSHGLSTHPRQR